MTFKPITHKAHNGYDTAKESDATGIGNFEPTLTIQSMAEDADINVLMTRYGLTGKFPEHNRLPTYEDYGEIFDFRSAVEAIQKAQAMFLEYPPSLRGRFENNPQLFLEFCSDPNNLEEMRRLGLAKEAPPAPPAGPANASPPGPNVPSTPPGPPQTPAPKA